MLTRHDFSEAVKFHELRQNASAFRLKTYTNMETGEGEIIILFQNFRFFLLDLCEGTAPQNLGTTPYLGLL